MGSLQIINRYFLALSICLGGVVASFIFLQPKDDQYLSASKVILARLINKDQNVQKKAPNQIKWMELSNGENLYQGEVLRTGEKSSAKIQFEGEDSYVDIDENSMIVIDKVDKKFSLNVLEGGLFVDNSLSGDQSAIELTSEGRTVSLDKAQISFKKNSKKGLDIDVIEGNVRAFSKDNKGKLIEQGSQATFSKNGIEKSRVALKVVSPNYGQTIFLKNNEKVKISFTPGDQKKIQLFWGKRQDQLELLDEKNYQNTDGNISLTANQGIFYWKIVGDDNQFSQVYKNKIVYINQPVLLAPADGEIEKFFSKNAQIQFSFTNPLNYQRYVIEIASDQSFAKIIKTIQTKSSEYLLEQFLPPNIYFWRVKGIYDKGNSYEFSEVFRFTVQKMDLYPPKIIFPANQFEIYSNSERFVDIQWEEIKGVSGYEIKIVKNGVKVFSEKTSSSSVRIKLKKKGGYQVFLKSLEGKKSSKWSLASSFSFKAIPEIEFVDFKDKFPFRENESIRFDWNGKLLADELYEIEILRENKEVKKIKTKKGHFYFSPSVPGKHQIQVRKKSELDDLIGESKVMDFVISSLEKLARPKVLNIEELQKVSSNIFTVEFSNIPGAVSYKVVIKNRRDEVIRIKKTDQNKVNFSKIYPGRYTLNVLAIDQYGNEGEFDDYGLIIISKSSIKAPVIKRNKVE